MCGMRLIGFGSSQEKYSSSEINFLSRMIENNDARERRANSCPSKLITASRENILVFINLAFSGRNFLWRESLEEADQALD